MHAAQTGRYLCGALAHGDDVAWVCAALTPSNRPVIGSRKARRTRRRLLLVGLVVLVVSAVVGTVLVLLPPAEGDIGDDARIDASSQAFGRSPEAAVRARPESAGGGWQAVRGDVVGAWIRVRLPSPRTIRSVEIRRTALTTPGILSGYLTFGDGSLIAVRLERHVRTTVVPVTARTTGAVRFTVASAERGTTSAALTAFAINGDGAATVVNDAGTGGGNAAAAARISAPGADPEALIDGSDSGSKAALGESWSMPDAVGAQVSFRWAQPREVIAIEIVGADASTSTIRRATLRFDDGSTIPIGAVPAATAFPTVVGFMPRSVTTARLTIDETDGTGPLSLSEIRIVERGTTPSRPAAATSSGQITPLAAATSCSGAAAPASRLVVQCPVSGTETGDSQQLLVAAPGGYTAVTAQAWSASGGPVGPVVEHALSGGTARLTVNLKGLDPGLVVVHVRGVGLLQPSADVFLQLFHGPGSTARVKSSARAHGRTLVFDEEFDGPISISADGAGATYAASKPEAGGAAEFGDAIFADPALGLGNVTVVPGGALRLQVSPTPEGFTDPRGWDRTSLGGILASARPGGSGFSSQYGYFEARMLAPAAPGTWPAFWLLPAPGLVPSQPTRSEIDAVELYGHDPQGACHTSHAYGSAQNGGVARCGRRFTSVDSAMRWHLYGVSVEPTQIKYFIDGRLVASAPQVPGGEEPMFFLIDLALGGGWPIDLAGLGGTTALYVDCVRVYQ